MDLVDDERVPARDQPVFEPATGDAGRHDDHIPTRRFRSSLALAIDHTDPQRFGQNGFGNVTNTKRLTDAGAGHNPESFSPCRPLPKLVAVLALEQRIEVKSQSEPDGLARGTRR